MKSLLATGAVLLLTSTAAFAADMPAYQPEAATVAETGVNWSGFYIGAHGGWNWGSTDEDGSLDVGDMEGFVIGGQAGYNWQWDSWLLGLEADGSYVDNDEESSFGGGIEQNYLATFRGRLGFTAGNFLLYGTGGAAFTGLDSDVLGSDDDANFFGWAAGGGIEYAISENVTFGVEYLHYEFDDENIDDGLGAITDIGLDNDVIRGRLNIKFGSLFN